jgi:SH3-like domain-containing protein
MHMGGYMKRSRSILLIAIALLGTGVADAQTGSRKLPYWASIAAGDALLRTGPGRNYPATWRYRRTDLPVKIVQVHESWRRIREQDGTEGWMAAALLSAERTALVAGSQPAEMRAEPAETAKLLWRVEPGVIGRIADCQQGWCRFDVKGQIGYIAVSSLWGVDPQEKLE